MNVALGKQASEQSASTVTMGWNRLPADVNVCHALQELLVWLESAILALQAARQALTGPRVYHVDLERPLKLAFRARSAHRVPIPWTIPLARVQRME